MGVQARVPVAIIGSGNIGTDLMIKILRTSPALALEAMVGAANLNMVTCGGQATIPIVAAIGKVTPVLYAEIVASIASRSAGPGMRANIDEFTETTARAIEQVGGARHGKAIIVLNPAEPPLVMRDTVYCLTGSTDEDAIEAAVQAMVGEVQSYVPGYRLKQRVQVMRRWKSLSPRPTFTDGSTAVICSS